MAYQSIGLGTSPGDGTGDDIRDGGDKINDNFDEIYDIIGDGSLFTEDMDLLSESILFENDLTEFQWWAGDIDYDESHSVFDLLRLSDLLEN